MICLEDSRLRKECSSLSTHFHSLFGNCSPTSIIKAIHGGAWVAQSLKRLTLDFGSGHDFMVHEFESCVGLCAVSVEPAWDSLSLFLCWSPTSPLKINELKKKTTLHVEYLFCNPFSLWKVKLYSRLKSLNQGNYI